MTDYSAQADVLDDAADLIERDGWFNGKTKHITTEHCAYTAIGEVSRGRVVGVFAALTAFVPASSVFKWNDSFDNPQPVLDGLRLCAKELRQLADGASF